jgi:hypothetical protein
VDIVKVHLNVIGEDTCDLGGQTFLEPRYPCEQHQRATIEPLFNEPLNEWYTERRIPGGKSSGHGECVHQDAC